MLTRPELSDFVWLFEKWPLKAVSGARFAGGDGALGAAIECTKAPKLSSSTPRRRSALL